MKLRNSDPVVRRSSLQMVALPSFYSAVIIITAIVSSLNVEVRGFDESSCPENAIIDLTSNTSEEFTENLTWSRDDRRLGCICDVKTCVLLCCASGMGQVDGWRCVDDNVTTFETLPVIKNLTYKDFHPIVDNPCSFNWMAPSVLTEFAVLPNGSLHTSRYAGGSLSDFEQYCLFRRPGSDQFLAKVCRPWLSKYNWVIIAVVMAILIMVTIFFGSTTIPEMRNLHGLTFRCYIASYIGTYVCVLGTEFTTQRRTLADVYTPFGTMTRYWGGCCVLWLNVMSINIWRSFRWLKPVDHRSIHGFERKLFIYYAIYAHVTPAILIAISSALIYTVPKFRDEILRHAYKQWSCAAGITIMFIFNGLLYTSTALRIRQHKKATTHLVDGVNKHHEVDKQWLNLHLKLFVIMGGHLMMWSIYFVWTTPAVTHIFAPLEVIQSLLIFFIFLWKPSFKQAVRERVSSAMRMTVLKEQGIK